jgi:dihydroorotase-like cyclic amidohydrolase
MKQFDTIVKGGHVVVPRFGVVKADIGLSGEKIAAIATDIPAASAGRVVDATGCMVFPGAVDSHLHVGIYRPMSEDATSESTAAASAGITTLGSYFRTGSNYLNKSGTFREIFPELLSMSRDSYLTDYVYHLALMSAEQLAEVDWLVSEAGVSTFKYYMFYKMLDLTGSARSDNYLMLKEPLDCGFLYRFMTEVARANEKYRQYGGASLSIHCEQPEIIRVTSEDVKKNPSGNAMKDYSDARPPWEEELAIKEVGIISKRTGCPVNLLHLSSKEAVDAGRQVVAENRGISTLLEATLHHLHMTHENDYGMLGKVNPPVRTSKDVDYLWNAVISGDIRTVVSDHSSNPSNLRKGDLWTIMPGFGGLSLMFPVMITEGYHKRGVPLSRIAELVSLEPAIAHNLFPKKGSIMVGGDADLCLVDINEERTLTNAMMHSSQDYTPAEGEKFKGWVKATILRGQVIYDNGKVVGKPGYGQYVKRPVGLHGSK